MGTIHSLKVIFLGYLEIITISNKNGDAMKRVFLIMLISSLIIRVSYAGEREEIGKCAAKRAPAERLMCFDALAKSLAVDKNVVETLKGHGKWSVTAEKSPINDATNVTLVVEADNKIQTGYKKSHPFLVIRCSENKTEFYINWGIYLGLESTKMLVRADKQPAITRSWTLSTDSKAAFYSGKTIEYIKQLMKHSTLLAQITPYGENPVMTTFNIQGLQETIKPLRESCKW